MCGHHYFGFIFFQAFRIQILPYTEMGFRDLHSSPLWEVVRNTRSAISLFLLILCKKFIQSQFKNITVRIFFVLYIFFVGPSDEEMLTVCGS